MVDDLFCAVATGALSGAELPLGRQQQVSLGQWEAEGERR